MVLITGAGLSGSSFKYPETLRADPNHVPTSDFFLHLCKPFSDVDFTQRGRGVSVVHLKMTGQTWRLVSVIRMTTDMGLLW